MQQLGRYSSQIYVQIKLSYQNLQLTSLTAKIMVLFKQLFFVLLTFAELKASNWLKAFFFALSQQKKRNAWKELQKEPLFQDIWTG